MTLGNLRCSFCDKSVNAVDKMISAPSGGAAICNECVRICGECLDGKAEPRLTELPRPAFLPLWLVRMFGRNLR